VTLRRRVERDYLQLKQVAGLGHFESRGWQGVQHHATLCIAAYGVLISEWEAFPLTSARPGIGTEFAIPEGYRPRAAPPCGLNGMTPSPSIPSVSA